VAKGPPGSGAWRVVAGFRLRRTHHAMTVVNMHCSRMLAQASRARASIDAIRAAGSHAF
jgi:hypothetical protein